MKKLFSTLAALLALAAGAADAALLKMTPKDCSAVISADIRGLLRHPEFSRIAAKPGTIAFLAEAEKLGVRLDFIREIAVFNWDDCWYGVFRVENAAGVRDLLTAHQSTGKAPLIVTETTAGRRIYRFRDPKRQDARRRKKELCAVFMDDGAILVAKAVELEKFLRTPRADAAETTRLAANRAEAWAEYRRRPGKSSGGDDGETFDARLKSGKMEIKLADGADGGIEFLGTAEFVDHEAAESMSMTLPGMLAFFAGMVFSEDPEGGDMFVKALRSKAEGNTLRFSLHAPGPLFGRLLRALENFFGDKEHDGGAAVPARRTRGGYVK